MVPKMEIFTSAEIALFTFNFDRTGVLNRKPA